MSSSHSASVHVTSRVFGMPGRRDEAVINAPALWAVGAYPPHGQPGVDVSGGADPGTDIRIAEGRLDGGVLELEVCRPAIEASGVRERAPVIGSLRDLLAEAIPTRVRKRSTAVHSMTRAGTPSTASSRPSGLRGPPLPGSTHSTATASGGQIYV
jgi:hypothetical protein